MRSVTTVLVRPGYMIKIDTYTLNNLLGGLGITGLQVADILSVDDDNNILQIKPVYGFIFVCKWEEPVTSIEHLVTEGRLDQIFFAEQVLPNTCATQALITIVLNAQRTDLQLDQILTKYKDVTKYYDAKARGLRLTKNNQIRDVNNKLAGEPIREFDLSYERKGNNAFHCVAYIPFNGRLYELDGLQIAPIDHGVIPEGSEWTDLARSIIIQNCNYQNNKEK